MCDGGTCSADVNNRGGSVIDYSNVGHSSYSIITCKNSATCTNDIASFNTIFIDCKGATSCTNILSSTSTSTISATKVLYPIIDCSTTTSSCSNTLSTVSGVKILSSNSPAVTTTNTFTGVQNFLIDCGT